MAEISMNKAIHSAFRRDLDRFIAALNKFSAGDHGRALQLQTAWKNFDHQLTRHHEGEHEIAWPAMKSIGVSNEVLTQMDAEHAKMADAIAEVRGSLATLARTPTDEAADETRTALATLQEVTVRHLDSEEAQIEDLYMSKRETAAIKAMDKAFSRTSPSEGGRFFAWMLDGASPDVHATMDREVPGPVQFLIGGLFGRSYRKNVASVWTS